MANDTPLSPSQSIPTITSEYDYDPETGAVLIPLSSRKYPGHFALVDPVDADAVSAHRWNPAFRKRGTLVYAISSGTRTPVLMHRFILNLSDPTIKVDHKNHNGLDNRRGNLRVATTQQNSFNQRRKRTSSSRYKGVAWDKQVQRWRVQIMHNGRNRHIGYFDDEREAAEVYDGAALMLFGSRAYLNFPDEGEVAS